MTEVVCKRRALLDTIIAQGLFHPGDPPSNDPTWCRWAIRYASERPFEMDKVHSLRQILKIMVPEDGQVPVRDILWQLNLPELWCFLPEFILVLIQHGAAVQDPSRPKNILTHLAEASGHRMNEKLEPNEAVKADKFRQAIVAHCRANGCKLQPSVWQNQPFVHIGVGYWLTLELITANDVDPSIIAARRSQYL